LLSFSWLPRRAALAPKYKVVARNLQGKVRVGGVNCDEKSNAGLCQKYQIEALSVDFHHRMLLGEVRRPAADLEKNFGVTKFPTLLAFAKGESLPTAYDGAMDHPSLFGFLKKFALPASPPAGGKGATEGKKQKQPERNTATAAEPEPFDPSIPQIAAQEDLRSSCLDARGVCVLAFSVVEPEFEESLRAHNETLRVLSSVKQDLHSTGSMSQFRFYWIDALTEYKLADDFRLSDNRPALMALNPRRSAYQPFTGAFDEEGIKRWLNDITSNRGRSFMYDLELKMAAESKKGARGSTANEGGPATIKKEEL
ncbi:MAG: hypothetical protein BJ554DRAFT_8450, partial [Olpidium bornovanus]